MKVIDILLNIIFPASCLTCGKNGTEFCLDCLYDSPNSPRPTEDWIFPIFDYRHIPIKKSIWLLKYKGRKRFAKIFANVLYGRILEELADLQIMKNFQRPILIPIPLSFSRKKERGYNQTELMAKELVKLDRKSKEISFNLETDILIKIKDTEHQARIKDRALRLKNLINSFVVKNSEKLKNRNVILLDDVTTTGATLREAKKILKQNGVKKIIAFTIAH